MADFRAIIARAKRQADKTSGYSGYSGYALEKVNQNSDLAHTRRVTSDESAPITAVTALQPSDQRVTTVTTERGSVVTGTIEINQHLTVDVTAVTNVTNKNREEANFEIGEDAKRTLAFAPGLSRAPGPLSTRRSAKPSR